MKTVQTPNRTLRIIESRPEEVQIPAEVRAISIAPDPANLKAKARIDQIDEVIRRLPGAAIALLDIDYDSQLRRLPRLDALPNLRFVNIAGRRLEDVHELFPLEHLESLSLVAAHETSLAGFASRAILYLRLIRGRVERLDLPARFALLQGCMHLRQLAAVEIMSLTLEACRRVDLASTSAVQGLRRLSLLAPGPITDFDFLPDCRALESLQVTATPLGKTSFAALAKAPALKRVFLGAGDALVARVANDFPHLLVTNSHVTFRNQQSLPKDDYYREEKLLDQLEP